MDQEEKQRRERLGKAAAAKREERNAARGMGFFLQQIRSSATSAEKAAPSTSVEEEESESSGTPPKKKPRGEDEAQAPSTSNQAEVPPEQPVISRKVRVDLQLPTGQDFYSSLEPEQVLAECFRQGTTPDFGAHIRRFIGENNYVRTCKWSPDGQWLLTDSVDRLVRAFAFTDEKLSIHRQLPFGGLVYDLGWSPHLERPQFATTSRGQPIHCWTPQGQLVASFRGINDQDELDSAYSFCFSLGGDKIFAGYRNLLRIFEMDRPGKQVGHIRTYQKGTMSSQKGLLSALAICPSFDGCFAAASYAGTLGLYSTHTGACDCLIGGTREDQKGLTHLQYSSNGQQLFVGLRKSPLIHCYDLRMPTRLLASYRRSAETSQRFYFQLDPHDHYLYSGSSRGELLIYDLKKGGGGGEEGEEEGIGPCHRVKCSRAAVTGLSLHPEEALVAISTGQRLFPDILGQLFPDESPAPAEGGEEATNTELEQYSALGKGSPLVENSVKLFRLTHQLTPSSIPS